MSEPGYWTLNDQEAEGLRTYLAKGGFIIFDDFRQEHWYNFEAQLRKVLPTQRLVPLDGSHPVFHAFFEIDPSRFVSPYGGLTPTFHGIFEDNDPAKRLQVVANYDNDLGEYLGVLGHRLGADRPVERGLQVRRELHRVRYDALDSGPGPGARVRRAELQLGLRRLLKSRPTAMEQTAAGRIRGSSQHAGGPERTGRHRARRPDEPGPGADPPGAEEAHRRPGRGADPGAADALRRRQQPRRRRARPGQDAADPHDGPGAGPAVLAHPVHARPDALGHHRHRHHPGGHHHRPAPDDLRARPDLHQHPARRRDQPHAAQDPVGVARGDAGAPGHHPGPHLHARRAVLRLRHPEPDRARRHLSAARGPARPLHVPHRHRASARGGGVRGGPHHHGDPRAPVRAHRDRRGPDRLPAPGPPGAGGRTGDALRPVAGARQPAQVGLVARRRAQVGVVRRQRARGAVPGARRPRPGR